MRNRSLYESWSDDLDRLYKEEEEAIEEAKCCKNKKDCLKEDNILADNPADMDDGNDILVFKEPKTEEKEDNIKSIVDEVFAYNPKGVIEDLIGDIRSGYGVPKEAAVEFLERALKYIKGNMRNEDLEEGIFDILKKKEERR